MTGTQDTEHRAIEELAVVGNVEFVRVLIAIAYSHKLGITLHSKRDIAYSIGYSTTLAIDSDDAQMLQVLSIGLPEVIVGHNLERLGLACSFDAMTGYHLSIGASYGLQATLMIDDLLPTDLVAVLG